MIIKLLVDGGNMKPGPALAQKLGPLGLNMGKICLLYTSPSPRDS